jgi:hypothetical protein
MPYGGQTLQNYRRTIETKNNEVKRMTGFIVTETVMKPGDTLAKFEKKVKNAKNLDAAMVQKFLTELNAKEGHWGIEESSDIRAYLEEKEE